MSCLVGMRAQPGRTAAFPPPNSKDGVPRFSAPRGTHAGPVRWTRAGIPDWKSEIRLVGPFAIDHFDDDAGAVVETGVIGRAHGENALRGGQVLDLLDGVAQGFAELGGARLGAGLQG